MGKMSKNKTQGDKCDQETDYLGKWYAEENHKGTVDWKHISVFLDF